MGGIMNESRSRSTNCVRNKKNEVKRSEVK